MMIDQLDLEAKRRRAELSQRVVIVSWVVAVIVVLALQMLMLFRVSDVGDVTRDLSVQNRELNKQLLRQQALADEAADEITQTTLDAIACAEPPGPESAAQIRECVERRAIEPPAP